MIDIFGFSSAIFKKKAGPFPSPRNIAVLVRKIRTHVVTCISEIIDYLCTTKFRWSLCSLTLCLFYYIITSSGPSPALPQNKYKLQNLFLESPIIVCFHMKYCHAYVVRDVHKTYFGMLVWFPLIWFSILCLFLLYFLQMIHSFTQ